jgi:hypothetical protein
MAPTPEQVSWNTIGDGRSATFSEVLRLQWTCTGQVSGLLRSKALLPFLLCGGPPEFPIPSTTLVDCNTLYSGLPAFTRICTIPWA